MFIFLIINIWCSMIIKTLLRFMMFILLGMSLYSAQPYNDYETFLKDFKNIGYDKPHAKKIQSFILPLNYAEIFMEDGVYYPLTALNGRTYGGLFVGTGNFEFNIPDRAEKCQLKRYYQREAINSPIEWVLVFSASDLHKQIMEAGVDTNSKKELPESPLGVLKFANLTINQNVVNGDIAKAILDAENNNYSYHVIKCKDIDDPLIYEIVPNLIEPVLLHRAMPHTFGSYSELINQFYPKDAEGRIVKAKHDDNYVQPLKYKIDIKFSPKNNPIFTTNVELKALKETGTWIVTRLFTKCDVADLRVNGEKAYYFMDYLYSSIYIKLPKSYSAGDTFKLDIKYASAKGTYFEFAGGDWYPKFGNGMKSIYETTARSADSNLILRFVGDELAKTKENGEYISRWVTSIPVYRTTYINVSGADSTTVRTKTGNDFNIWTWHKWTKDEIASCMNIFEFSTFLFGELPDKKVCVTSGNGNASQGFAFIHPYSIADLWWQSVLNTASYREVWLETGICGYTALLYQQSIQKDSVQFYCSLEKFSKDIIAQTITLFSKSKKTGIISIGYRNSNEYWDIIKLKSTWVFHMLRNMMLDLNTMNEDVFVTTLRDFFSTYKGKEVTTQDFRDCVEKNTKFDFSWFFEQWLNTNDIPKYSYAYKTEKIDGKYVTKFKVKQENVPADFKMLIPIALIDDDKKTTATRAYITGDKVIEFALAPTDTEPNKVVFNYLNSVLCELDEIGWNSF